jgi:hypothetical protein
MKKAIDYLKTLGITCSDDGTVLSKLPDGERGIQLIDMLEEATMSEDYCFTIINNKIEKIDC